MFSLSRAPDPVKSCLCNSTSADTANCLLHKAICFEMHLYKLFYGQFFRLLGHIDIKSLMIF